MSCQLSYDRLKHLSLHKIILLKYFSANTESLAPGAGESAFFS